ncbi:hypothetical protein NP493_333g00027 [Ridgeia piscesae]|uniref:Uncharacterized protein n=1 Tax=Ridgeia piscesae TaxID=27915 RepID=A0AAD9L564_RIDPI|nr:hypothetical protein NP493_333g00027 [Ridgeia piscesae]
MDSPNAIEAVYITTLEFIALCDVVIAVSPGEDDDDSDRTVCATHRGCLAAGHTTRVSCDNPVFGQTLYIDTLDGNNHTLILCEVAAAMTTCPPLLLVDGEVCNDTSCTTNKKLYGDKCIVSYKTGYNLSTTNDVHECTQNGSWSDHDLRKRRMCNRDRLIDC